MSSTLSSSQGPIIPRLWHDFKQTFMGKPHSLHEVKASLLEAEKQETDFIYLLKHHHDFLQESISVIGDQFAEDSDKQWHLSRFLHLLTVHSKAEQETLYRNLSQNSAKEARLQGITGREEHALITQLSEELYGLGFEDEWSELIDSKARVLGHLVAHHIQEEESEMFPVVERCLEESEMASLMQEYINKCEGYLEIEMQSGYRL